MISPSATTRGEPPAIVREGQHEHAPDQDDVAASQLVNKIKEVSTANAEMPPVQITSNTLQNVPPVVLAKLPNDAAIRRTIQRTRQSTLPANPKSI